MNTTTQTHVDRILDLASTETDVVHPKDFTGTQGEMITNAKRFVEYVAAIDFADLIAEDDHSPQTAARMVLDQHRRTFGRIAQFPPKSSDWLALPRWAAEVAALAEFVEHRGHLVARTLDVIAEGA